MDRTTTRPRLRYVYIVEVEGRRLRLSSKLRAEQLRRDAEKRGFTVTDIRQVVTRP